MSKKDKTISTKLHTYDAAANLSTTNLSANNTHHLLAAASIHLLTTVSSNLLAPTNSNTATELTSKWNSKAKTNTTKLEINYLNLLVTPKDTTSNHPEPNQKQSLTSNISPGTVTNNKLLATIFPFKLEELTSMLLFSGTALKEKPIIMMYTDTKIDGQPIKLSLNSGLAGSIITKQLMNQLGCQVD
ncbi:hypothetical protein G9A89_014429 [Geosiphon pyriformis]|nr:hypothetical protein G9A89_014429 [Geosiphon pyriformis]